MKLITTGLFMLLFCATAISLPLDQNASTPVQAYQSATDEQSEPILVAEVKDSASRNNANQQSVRDELDEQVRTNVIYRQSVDNRLESINEQLKGLGLHFNKVDQALSLLNQQVTQLTNKMASLSQESQLPRQNPHLIQIIMSWVKTLQLNLGFYGFYTLMVIILVIFMTLVWAFLPRSKRELAAEVESNTTASNKGVDSEGEYDYMGSHESIPAQLNLARAYCAMEDYVAAKKIIAKVIIEGSASQCEEASALLSKIRESSLK